MKNPGKRLKGRFHHATDMANARFGVLRPSREETERKCRRAGRDPAFGVGPNLWLRDILGFYPLFLAVGAAPESARMTGYDDNWRRVKSISWESGSRVSELRSAGEFPNLAMFSFCDIGGAVFVDFTAWFRVLNSHPGYDLPASFSDSLLRPGRSRQSWLRAARRPNAVAAVVPELDLRDAVSAWVRSEKSAGVLRERGFAVAEAVRMRVSALPA